MVPLLFLVASAASNPAAAEENELPTAAAQALRAAGKVILYSLEPWERPAAKVEVLHGFKVLGQTGLDPAQRATAVSAFQSAISGWNGLVAMCFDPRHALRVTTATHVYDYLLCYACNQLYVYEDDKLLGSVGVTGSAKVLNGLLTAAKIPVSKSDSEEERAAREKEREVTEARWFNAMPKSIRPLWRNAIRNEFSPDLVSLRTALVKEFPDARQRILALFAWFGSGEGPWSGFPSYETVTEELLFDLPTPDLIAAAQTNALTVLQIEGAARLFGGWEFGQRRPGDLKTLPPDLKKRLLDHSLKSTDADKRGRAQYAFAER